MPVVPGLAGAWALGGGLRVLAPVAAAWAGWVDDRAGQPETKGWAGHLRASLVGRRLSTGALKASAVGAAAALRAVLEARREGPRRAVLTALSTALTANALNQLDTRPGRASCGFLAGFAALVALARPDRRARLLTYLPLTAGVLGYLPYDRRGQVMLGDTGANALGAALGAAAGEVLDCARLARWVLAAASFNLVADTVSLSGVWDRIARGRHPEPAVRLLSPPLKPLRFQLAGRADGGAELAGRRESRALRRARRIRRAVPPIAGAVGAGWPASGRPGSSL